jgi:hypothetical protein
MMTRLHTLLLGAAALLAPTLLRAQENFELGRMWTFERPPLDYLEAEYGFRPTQEWLDYVRLASLRFGGGCSASFVSPKGLILTNHHCVRDNIADNQGANDWVKDGFVATGLDDEVRLEGLTVQQLVQMREVTKDIEAGTEGLDSVAATERREQNAETVLEAARSAEPELEHEIVVLFQGAIRMLYSYKIYDDIRLVVAPHLQAAHFGGDFDNFVYPRYCTDFAFCRAYENGEPADTTKFYFRWRLGGAKENELVFITGNPGSTNRLMTKAQFEYQRDGYFPWVRELVDNRIEVLRSFAARSPQIEKQLRTNILSLENAQKAFRGQHEGLQDPKFMARKDEAEAAFQKRIQDDPELKAKYAGLWKEIAAIAKERTALEFPLKFHSEGGSTHLRRAVKLVEAVRAADEETREAALEQMRSIPLGGNPIQDALFVDHIARAAGKLPADDPYVRTILAGGTLTPEQAAERIASSRIGDEAFVDEILADPARIDSTEDLALQVAAVIAPAMADHEARSTELVAREEALGVEIGRALFAAYGTQVSPDATFTLRFSDGRVQGYDYNGTKAPWRTTMFGLYARAYEFDFEYPWDMAAEWREARDRIDLTTPINFVATCDSTGGNSGSPMIDKDGNLVGLLFDGNIESLPNDFIFRDEVERSVMVHVDGILEALHEVYEANRIAAELVSSR